jgi:cation diffusion facilitator CzcD-associated flavoprotein CzcO
MIPNPEILEVAVLGAGFAGIGMGIRLKREGNDSFVILERAGEVGGTWRDNRYPGVACDVPSHLYSYSFRPKPDWSRVFAPGAEILDYLRDAVRDEGLAPHLRLDTEVLAVTWNDGLWRIDTSQGGYTARSVVVAVGRLSEPVADIVDGFDGLAFHSSRWPDDLDLAGKRVGVVGTGASAAQLVPRVAEVADQLVVFQRSAAWVIPREDRAFTADEMAGFTPAYRDELFEIAEQGFAARALEPAALSALRERATSHLQNQVTDVALRALLTPPYEIGCKRVVISDDFYPALERENVTLEASAVVSAHGNTVTAAADYELDVLIFATGFTSTRPPYAALITGTGGETLAAHWSDGMTAFASTVVYGFPNLFIVNGPNATLGHNSAIHVMESQFGYVLGALDHIAATGESLDVSADAERAYTADIDARAAETVWTTGGCSSWYLDASSRRLTLIYPGTAADFRRRNGTFDPAPFVPVLQPVE